MELTLGEDNSLVHGLTVIVAVELHINTSYSQHLELKSVYEKGQYIMAGKSCFSRTVFGLAHAGSSSYLKQVT